MHWRLRRLKEVVAERLKPPLEWLSRTEARWAARWASAAYRRLMWTQWELPPQPEHFDHRIDLYHIWPTTRSPEWLERGIFGNLALRGNDVLELACGDGFNARYFYSLRSRRVVACDFDPRAIRTATQVNPAANIEYRIADIRSNMPAGKFDNIVWDAAIEHFTPDEIQAILGEIKNRLAEGGILSGYTIVRRADGNKSLSHHEYEFASKEELFGFLRRWFKNVTVFETLYPDRHNLYFWASDGTIPFHAEWTHAVRNMGSAAPLD